MEMPVTFTNLLERIDGETGIKRIRFMTSHPKDLTDELISCYGRLKSLCEHIHLPVQSGSDSILQSMNRRYTVAHYLELVDKLRSRVPDIAISTDIIVGFPGETESDFNDTMKFVENVRFDAAYTFAYSSRKFTKAAEMPGQIEKKVKAGRLAELNALVVECMMERNEAYLGRDVEVFIDSVSRRSDQEISGRTRSAKTVALSGDASDIGKYITARIDKIKMHTLHGVRDYHPIKSHDLPGTPDYHPIKSHDLPGTPY
jgi:tRNA-2-methylthio-N6-dimethylallyladenosine synthase